MDELVNRQLKVKLNNLRILREQGYHYIARSEFGELRAFKKRPEKQLNFWYAKGELPHPIDPYDFDDVKWEDKQPLNILLHIKKLEDHFKKLEECE